MQHYMIDSAKDGIGGAKVEIFVVDRKSRSLINPVGRKVPATEHLNALFVRGLMLDFS